MRPRPLVAWPALVALGALVCGAPAARAQHASADYTAPYQRQALEIYRTIIGMRTAAGQGQVPLMAEYLAAQFRQGGFAADDVHVLPFSVPSGEQTAGLVVRYRGDGSSRRTATSSAAAVSTTSSASRR